MLVVPRQQDGSWKPAGAHNTEHTGTYQGKTLGSPQR